MILLQCWYFEFCCCLLRVCFCAVGVVDYLYLLVLAVCCGLVWLVWFGLFGVRLLVGGLG